jgi:apolipoprotein N-acyltransferase
VHAATHGRVLAARGLAVFCGLATPAGLFVPEGGARFWESAQYWSVFAAVCALVQLAPLARPVFGGPARRAWTIGAFGVAGLLLFWVLIVLPVVSGDSAFVLTAAVAAAAGGAWLSPGRRIPASHRNSPAAAPSTRGL